VPSFEREVTIGPMYKCTFCEDRLAEGIEPACVKACSTEALEFGERDNLITEASARMTTRPHKYTDHIYGEDEVGGTSWMYLSPVPFDRLGFPKLGDEPIAANAGA